MIVWKLDELMRQRRLKGREIARRMGIGENYLSRVRHEVPDRLSLSLLDALCEAMDCAIGDLLEYRPGPAETVIPPEPRPRAVKPPKARPEGAIAPAAPVTPAVAASFSPAPASASAATAPAEVAATVAAMPPTTSPPVEMPRPARRLPPEAFGFGSAALSNGPPAPAPVVPAPEAPAPEDVAPAEKAAYLRTGALQAKLNKLKQRRTP